MRGPEAASGTFKRIVAAGVVALGVVLSLPVLAQEVAPADLMASSFAEIDNAAQTRAPELTPALLSNYISSHRTARLGSRLPATAALAKVNALAALGSSALPPVPAVRTLTEDLVQTYVDDSYLPTEERIATLRSERRCLAQAVYHEARGEPEAGQWAVAAVILNRVHSPRYPNTVCGVVYQNAQVRNSCQFSFACDGKADDGGDGNRIVRESWVKSNLIAHAAYRRHMSGETLEQLPSGALYYHNRTVAPRWANSMTSVARIGGHIFYAAL